MKIYQYIRCLFTSHDKVCCVVWSDKYAWSNVSFCIKCEKTFVEQSEIPKFWERSMQKLLEKNNSVVRDHDEVDYYYEVKKDIMNYELLSDSFIYQIEKIAIALKNDKLLKTAQTCYGELHKS